MDAFNIELLSKRVERYLHIAEKIRQENNPDLIHDFRIASRTVLALEPLLRTTGKTRKWRKQMEYWLQALNHLRDLQVMQERFGEHTALQDKLAAHTGQELKQWESIRPHISDKAFRNRLQRSLERFIQRCETHPGYFAVTVLSLWWRMLGEVQTRFAAVKPDDPTTLHRLRVAFKSLRYLANTLRSLNAIPEDANMGLKHWHDLLGDIQDRLIAHRWLDQANIDPTLLQRQQREAADLKEAFLHEQLKFQQTLLQLDEIVTASFYRLLLNHAHPAP